MSTYSDTNMYERYLTWLVQSFPDLEDLSRPNIVRYTFSQQIRGITYDMLGRAPDFSLEDIIRTAKIVHGLATAEINRSE